MNYMKVLGVQTAIGEVVQVDAVDGSILSLLLLQDYT